MSCKFSKIMNKRRRQSSTNESISKTGEVPGRCIRVSSQTKLVIENVYQFFIEENQHSKSILRDRVQEHTTKQLVYLYGLCILLIMSRL